MTETSSRRWSWVAAVVGVGVTAGVVWLAYAGRDEPGSRRTDSAVQATTVQTQPTTAQPKPTTPRASSAPPRAIAPPATGKPAPKATTELPVTRPSASTVRNATKPGRPVAISVPRLGVSARVVAIRARGASLIPPSNPRVVGWWSDGAPPGAAKGSAIITGHTVHTGGGAFDDLDHLRIGDTFIVRTPKGRIGYRVTSVTIYRKAALAKHAAEVFDQGVAGRVVLVTCEDWNGSRYLSNAVVIGRPIG